MFKKSAARRDTFEDMQRRAWEHIQSQADYTQKLMNHPVVVLAMEAGNQWPRCVTRIRVKNLETWLEIQRLWIRSGMAFAGQSGVMMNGTPIVAEWEK